MRRYERLLVGITPERARKFALEAGMVVPPDVRPIDYVRASFEDYKTVLEYKENPHKESITWDDMSDLDLIDALGVIPIYTTRRELLDEAEKIYDLEYRIFKPVYGCDDKTQAFGTFNEYRCYPLTILKLLGNMDQYPVNKREQLIPILDSFTRYDTRILNTVDPELRGLIMINAVRNRLLNPTLSQLIVNFEEKKSKVVEFISGPKAISRYESKEYDKIIYLIGEVHGTENRCRPDLNAISMTNYIKDLFGSTPLFIDFYLEDWKRSFRPPPYHTVDFEIENLRYELNPCLIPGQRNCQWNTIRAHYIDTRMVDDPDQGGGFSISTSVFGRIVNKTQRASEYEEYKKKKEMEIEKLMKILAGLSLPQGERKVDEESIPERLEIVEPLGEEEKVFNQAELKIVKDIVKFGVDDIESFGEYMWTILEGMHTIRKELDRSNLDRVTIKSMFINTMYEDIELQDYLRYGIEQYKKSLPSDVPNVDVIKGYYPFLIKSESIFLDVYTMARVFKNFKHSPTMPQEQRNCIIYTGNAHSRRIGRFLQYLGFSQTELEVSWEGNSRCLDMRGIRQPLFQ